MAVFIPYSIVDPVDDLRTHSLRISAFFASCIVRTRSHSHWNTVVNYRTGLRTIFKAVYGAVFLHLVVWRRDRFRRPKQRHRIESWAEWVWELWWKNREWTVSVSRRARIAIQCLWGYETIWRSARNEWQVNNEKSLLRIWLLFLHLGHRVNDGDEKVIQLADQHRSFSHPYKDSLKFRARVNGRWFDLFFPTTHFTNVQNM